MREPPFAEGTLINHNPVAEDEATRIPETTRTYMLASVRAYTLDQIGLSDNRRRVDGYNHPTSSSGIRGRAPKRRRNNTLLILQCGHNWVPIRRLNI